MTGVGIRVLKQFILRPGRQVGGPTPGWLRRYRRELSASFRRREIVVWSLLLVPELNYTLIIAI